MGERVRGAGGMSRKLSNKTPREAVDNKADACKRKKHPSRLLQTNYDIEEGKWWRGARL
jgi:hypothetical protein